jgi:hypothetical protein
MAMDYTANATGLVDTRIRPFIQTVTGLGIKTSSGYNSIAFKVRLGW